MEASRAKRFRRNSLMKLFESQIQKLYDRGCPESIVNMLERQTFDVIDKASELAHGTKRIPFLPVIPRTYRNLHDLVAMVRVRDRRGWTHLNPDNISDVVKEPDEPYYIYNIGLNTEKIKEEEFRKEEEIRRAAPLNLAQEIALCIHTIDVLTDRSHGDHRLYILGSWYNSWHYPRLCIEFADGRPVLTMAGDPRID